MFATCAGGLFSQNCSELQITGDWPNYYRCLNYSLEIAKSNNDAEREADILYDLGSLFFKIGDYKVAEEYFSMAEVICQDIRNYELLSKIKLVQHDYSWLRANFHLIGNWAKVKYYLIRAQQNSDACGDGNIALMHLDSANQIEFDKNTLLGFQFFVEKCVVFQCLAIRDSAFLYLMKAKEYSDRSRDLEVHHHFEKTRYKYHNKFGNSEQTLRSYIAADSIRQLIDNKLIVVELEQFDKSQKINFEKNLKHAEQREKYYWIGISLLLILLIGVSGALISKLMQKNKLQKERNSDYYKLFLLLSHDIRSPLISLKYKIQDLDDDGLNKEIDGLLELTDQTIEWSSEKLESIASSYQSIKLADVFQENLFILQKLANRNGVVFKYRLQENRSIKGDIALLKFAVRILLLNSIQHASKNSDIEIYEDDSSTVYIKNKIGERDYSGKGKGIRLAKQLLSINRGKLEVEIEEGKFISKITFSQ